MSASLLENADRSIVAAVECPMSAPGADDGNAQSDRVFLDLFQGGGIAGSKRIVDLAQSYWRWRAQRKQIDDNEATSAFPARKTHAAADSRIVDLGICRARIEHDERQHIVG